MGTHVRMKDFKIKKKLKKKLWCWRRLLRVTWIARISNLSILREINPEYSVEKLMLKRQYFGLLMGRVNSLGKQNKTKPLILGNIEGRNRRHDRMRWLGGISNPME